LQARASALLSGKRVPAAIYGSVRSLVRMKPTIIGAMLLALVACASSGENTRTKVGAGAGAATGAVVGGAVGGWKGAAIGGVTGAAAGGVAGHLLDKQAEELKKKDIAATRTANGILVHLKNELLFETDSAVLKPQAVQHLGELADVLVKYPDDQIQVVGFTDDTGSEQHNRELSTRRAEAVRRVLVDRGIPEKRAQAIGMGEAQPVATNESPEGRAKNRRVELRIAMVKQ
jgi:outer membrane protein OmpA-like peptidoglycan-associated protein